MKKAPASRMEKEREGRSKGQRKEGKEGERGRRGRSRGRVSVAAVKYHNESRLGGNGPFCFCFHHSSFSKVLRAGTWR